jgi:DNA-binding NarL/FixJ family response regulator
MDDDERHEAGNGRSFRVSPRQREILRLVAEGQSDKEIARSLALSVTTVRTHLSRIYRSHGMRNRAEAASAWTARNAPLLSTSPEVLSVTDST